ncbi:hypothetical protein DKP76_11445 [Falsochrobactrum shanghaiense]|uniref:Uncharacterized protein n=1 Tax=Falsochrobactrum shanghaiense TaxID=2201899 RepID=A0A316J9D8_9HYPH|nr:hypothetical protein [Falsochrobactrum shanghaiense]PWL17385.1 hypothetical protein DKP76_11445 [Falsochrobactrum shanghaiense]
MTLSPFSATWRSDLIKRVKAVLTYEPQTLTNAQQQQARANIGAFSTSGGTVSGSVTVTGVLDGRLKHIEGGGYLEIGSFNLNSYGAGYGRLWFNPSTNTFTLTQEASGATTLAVNHFRIGATPTESNHAARKADVDAVAANRVANVRLGSAAITPTASPGSNADAPEGCVLFGIRIFAGGDFQGRYRPVQISIGGSWVNI